MKEEDAQGMEEKEAEGMGEKVFEEAIIEMRNLVRGVSRMSGLRNGIHKVRRIYFPNQQIQEGETDGRESMKMKEERKSSDLGARQKLAPSELVIRSFKQKLVCCVVNPNMPRLISTRQSRH
jgi:hypothetical protein